jgi:hypothetical protein
MRDIWSLEPEGQTLVFEQSKAAALYEFYDKLLGVPVQLTPGVEGETSDR